MTEFDSEIIDYYQRGDYNCSGWWDTKNQKPHGCMIVGDTSTRINLEWFIERDGSYFLTPKGEENYKIWLENNSLFLSELKKVGKLNIPSL